MRKLSIIVNKLKVQKSKLKLTTRLIVSLFIITIVCMTIFQVLSYKKMEREQRSKELDLINENLNITNNYINQIANNIKSLIFSISSMDYLFHMDTIDAVKTLKSIEAYNIGLVKSIFIKNDNGIIFTGNNQFKYEIMGNPEIDNILNEEVKVKNTIRFSKPYRSTTSGYTICIYLPMEGNRVVAVELEFTMFEQGIKNLLTANYRSYVIFSKQKTTLLYDRKTPELLPLIKNTYPNIVEYDEIWEIPEIDENYRALSHKNNLYRVSTDDNYFELEVHIICKNELFAHSIKNAYINAYLSTIFFIIVLALCLIGSVIILMKPVRDLGKRMAEIEKESDLKEIEVSSNDEIGKLCRSYNTLIGNMRVIIHNLKKSEQNKKEYELKMLRSQIGPHFLYNTLSCISSLSKQGRSQEVSNSISSLIKILTLIFDKSGEYITLEQEIEGIENYISIQKMRYGDIFDVTIDIQEEILGYHILKLTLQPIVENAIFHGLLPLERRGKIIIRINKKKDNLILLIADNGVGIENGRFNDILNGCSNKYISDRFSNIGLANVHQRIQLHFGDEYGIKIMSKIDVGTIIKVNIPINTNNRVDILKDD